MRHAPVDELLKRRARLLYRLALVAVAVLAGRLYLLQVVSGEAYRDDALANSVRLRSVEAPRGLIRDRTGRLLVGNRRSFDLVVDLERAEDFGAIAELVARVTGTEPEQTIARLEGAAEQRVVLSRDLLFSMVAYLEARQDEAPGLSVESRLVREYPEGDLAAHVLGYLGEVTQEELGRPAIAAYHRSRDLIGRGGVEAQDDRLLTGTRGRRRIVADALGRGITSELVEPPRRGANLELNLDLDVQRAAEQALAGRRGACVVLDVRDGSVIALASSPTFEPAAFVGGVSAVRWAQYRDNPSKPLSPRAIAGIYPAGSVWKPLVAAAALQTGHRRPSDETTCRGQVVVYGQTRRCWKAGGHGPVDLEQAIIHSCNVYFYLAARDIGLEPIHRLADAAGVGHRTGIDLPEERSGILPGKEWKRRELGEIWFPGDTINLSIGQGYLSVTPLQIAMYAMTIANGGTVYRPHVLRRVIDSATGETLRVSEPEITARVPFEMSSLRFLHQAMERTVESGTARRSQVAGVRVAGKTGTAQASSAEAPEGVAKEDLPDYLKEHAWYMGFAPVEAPEIAFAVVLEHSGEHGGVVAAPVARQVLEAWFHRGTAGVGQ